MMSNIMQKNSPERLGSELLPVLRLKLARFRIVIPNSITHALADPKSIWRPRYALPLLVVIALTDFAFCDDGETAQNKPKDHVSYILGHTIGKMIANLGISLKNLEPDDFILGMQESIDGKPVSLSEQEVVKAYQTIRQRGETNKKRIETDLAKKAKQYMKDLASKQDVIKFPNGVLYEVLKEGSGPAPRNGQVVSYSWATKRTDGTTIDSSEIRKATATFTLSDSAPSSEKGKSPTDAIAKDVFPLMKKDSKWKITIPPDLAYGPKGKPPFIQPHEVLSIEIEVLQVSDPSK